MLLSSADFFQNQCIFLKNSFFFFNVKSVGDKKGIKNDPAYTELTLCGSEISKQVLNIYNGP